MFQIHFSLTVLVALDAGEVFAVGRIRMALKAVIPCAGVRACEDGKKLSVVVPELALLTSRVANEALAALPTVAGNTIVFQIHFSLPVLVAFDASEVFAVGRIGMALKAVIPCAGVRTCEDWEKLSVVVSELALLTGWMANEAFAALPTVAGNAVMFQIHFSLPVLVALDAGEVFAVGRIAMARKAVVPCAGVRAREDGEELNVVVPELALFASRVTDKALVALPTVTGNAIVFQIHFTLPVLVTFDAGEVFAVGRIAMARKAIIPGAGVSARENWEELNIVVSELALLARGVTNKTFAALPTVAGNAVMFQVHFGLPVLMAFNASEVFAAGRVRVAHNTIIPYVGMVTRKNRKVEVVMFQKLAFVTSRVAAVAGLTFVAVLGETVVLAVHLALPMLMAVHTGEILAVLRVGVALDAVVPGAGMLTGKNWKKQVIVVLELTLFAGWVAQQTVGTLIGITRDTAMFLVHLGLLVLMAGQAGKILLGPRVFVAGAALFPFARMFPRENGKVEVIMLLKVTRLTRGMAG